MESYLFQGIVLPERAQLSLEDSLKFSHITSGFDGIAKVRILLNQLAVWIDSDHEWNIFDLRNVVYNLVQNHLNMVGYIKGFAYNLEITRIICRSRKIDHVYGIEVPCIAERGKTLDLGTELKKLRKKTHGPDGVFLTRCFNDLVSAMKYADDTGFYCYRAIESLRHHSAAKNGLSSCPKSKQWEKFREIADCEESLLISIKQVADPLRHGGVSGITSEERSMILIRTWNIVSSYLENA